jgi:hypothetical protein
MHKRFLTASEWTAARTVRRCAHWVYDRMAGISCIGVLPGVV